MSKFVVALTGGIASGKSTALNYFRELGVPCFDADQVAHELVAPNTPCFRKILAHFGKEILQPNGQLNRKKLRHIIFNCAEEKQWIEDLLHPIIYQTLLDAAQKANYPYAVLDIPLLTETLSKHDDFAKRIRQQIHRILVIDTPETLQRERLKSRDQIPKRQADFESHLQASRNDRLAIADDVISNTTSLKQLKKAIDKTHANYLNNAGK